MEQLEWALVVVSAVLLVSLLQVWREIRQAHWIMKLSFALVGASLALLFYRVVFL